MLMKSSYELLQAPTGSGGVFSLFSSHGITDKLIEMGVEYVQVSEATNLIHDCLSFTF